MEELARFLLTFAVGFAVGFVLHRLKVPGGMLVGAIIGTAALNILFDAAFVPSQAKVLAQIFAGAFIGSSVQRSDLHRLRQIYKPAAILLGMYLALNLLLGFLIFSVSELSLATAFFSAVPGGISDIPLIAADMGANAPQVAVMQFVRLVVGIAIFPGVINALCKEPEPCINEAAFDGTAGPTAPAPSKRKRVVVLLATLSAAIAFGLVGAWLKIPAGALLFALIAVIILKLSWGQTYFPIWIRRIVQVLSGAYIGRSFGLGDLLALRHLVWPAVILVAGYSANCFFSGWMLRRFCGMSRKESMLAATPAGASDMALISLDMGVQSADLVVLQVLRLVVVSSIFPQIIHLVLLLAG